MTMNTKRKSIRNIASLLFCLILVCTMVAAAPQTAYASDPQVVVTHDVDEIRELLQQDGDISIWLDDNAEKQITSYSDFEDDKWNKQYVWTKIGSGNKTIDLNGYRLYVYDQSAQSLGSLDWLDFRYIQGALLMEIPKGASLTVNDSSGGGKIWMDAEMPDKSEIEGSDLLMERNIFAVTGGNLTVNGGEIHAGRSKEIYAQNATKYDKDYDLIPTGSLFGVTLYDHLYGYATWFLSGTAITSESGNVTINGGDIWGRGWDNWTLITRVPGAPNGADDFRDRCAALRVKGGQVTINSGNFYGRSDADTVQVSNPANLTVNAGSFDVGTNNWLVVPGVDLGGTSDAINNVFFHDSVFDVHEGYVGSFGVPHECINYQSVKIVKGNTMTLSKNSIDPYKVVDEVNIYINSPLAYQTPAEEVYNVPDGCTVESITWYHDGSKVDNPEDTYFVEGDSYYVKIALSVDIDAGTKFKNNLTDVTINGMDAELYRAFEETIVLTARFGECIAALDYLEFSVIEPKQGDNPSYWVGSANYELYDAVGGYSNYIDFRIWYVSDDGETNWTEMSSEDTFEAGKYYRLSFEVHTGEGQEFALDGSLDPAITAMVNGNNATVSRVYEQDPSEHVAVTVDLGKCPDVVQQVELTVSAPVEGEIISYTVGTAHDSYYAIGDNSNYTYYRQWYESDTGYDNWTLMSPGDSFEAGKYYKFVTDIYTNSGYVFDTYDDGTFIQPNVYAYVNNYAANVSKGYEQDPARYITVEYFFGPCNDDVVGQITITNIDAPVVGRTPDYLANCFGTGYSMAGTNSGNWKINGIVWLRDGDNYTGSIMDKTEKFQAGHEYTVMIDLVPDYGYTFLFDHGNSIYAAASINGNTAQINLENCSTTGYQVWYTFTCEPEVISTITLTDLDTPQEGKTPDTEVTVESSYYTVQSVTWMNVEDIPVDSFEEGEYYIVEIVVDSVSVEGVDCCIFDDEVTAYIDGAEVTGWYNSVTTNNDNTVTIRYEFRRPASAPEAPVGATVSGTITSFGSSGANLNLQLIPSGSQEPVCETTTGENNDNFDFSGVEAGSYIVRVSKENHVTRDYEVTVGEDPVNLDVKLHLVGDINGDGNINVADYMPVLAHAKGVSDLSGYSKLCGDITEDDNINVADYMPILAHAKGISQLWQ